MDLLTNIIEAYKTYQLSAGTNKKSSTTDFANWLNEQAYQKEEAEISPLTENIGNYALEVEISTLVICLNRYSRLLIKKGLINFPQLVSEDFTYLYTLMDVESMTKIQLIEKNVHEKPTGLEVIKRLLKHGLVDERNDEIDKRSKRVFLTDKGKALFFATIEQMNKVAIIVSGNLTIDEKKHLHTLLKKLEDFHNPIYLSHKEISIDQLVEKTTA
ncbi:MAG: winged helix-turn-helix transcriptional regulator [Flavobacterium sp.]|nr:winged helix-turn-helix transcriptional regulator [Flavobacterium sp.]